MKGAIKKLLIFIWYNVIIYMKLSFFGRNTENAKFKNHKGYPTKKHIEAMHEYGLIEGYRKTYGPVKEMLEEIK